MTANDSSRVETIRSSTESYYKDYDARKGVGRNDLLRNPEVLFQFMAAEASVIQALRSFHADPATAKVLDVGCGEGLSLLPFLRLGFSPSNLYGVDIRPEQLAVARARFPMLHLQCGDASRLEFSDDAFDIVQEQVMFLQIPDDELAGRIGAEMVRVTRPGGYLVISDWRYSKPGSTEFKGVNRKRLARLFSVGTQTSLERVFPGPMVPPVGRFFSKNLPSLYFAIRAVFPFLTGQVTTVLKKLK